MVITPDIEAPDVNTRKNKFKKLSDYKGIVQDDVLADIEEKARQLKDARVAHVNATSYGGGVAEILDNMVLLMNDLGVRTDWRVLHGIPDFFEVTKKFHNALQGKDSVFSEEELDLYSYINEKFAQFVDLGHDYVIIHDPQPCALVQYVPHERPWIWRCHIDITKPNKQAWKFMEPFIAQYQTMIVSSEIYRHPTVTIPQTIVSPSIDPLSPKNMDLSEEVVQDYLATHKIPRDKPLITQVSRFDPWKDPEGVLKVFQKVKESKDCRLVFVYNMASDDPEGARIYARMEKEAKPFLETGDVLFVRGDDPILVNVMQRISDVVIQKSTREGFGLVVTEALWKETPVVASNVGGIPTQIVDGETGFLVDPKDYDFCAEKIVNLLDDEALAKEVGRAAKEYVRENFLLTRHLQDYFGLMLSL